ncbi:MAG: serine hydrolase domain-containing protein [Pseudomonadota bacterium]
MRAARFSLLASLSLLAVACQQAEESPAEVAEVAGPTEQAAVENALLPAVVFTGEEITLTSLRERMEQLGIPAVSIAVMQDGNLLWAEAYGDGMDPGTRFQAASMSKVVASVGIATIAAEVGTSLDEDISSVLEGLDMAQVNPEGVPITLRALLSHTNGATVGGFPGYKVGTDIPSTVEVIMGIGPTNTDPVVINPNPEGNFRYSGGGFTIAQLWAEIVTGEPFDVLMDRYVLRPIGMEASTFAMRTPDELDNAAKAHVVTGEPIEGGWHLYPEMAAASLWTTPTDYLKFVRALDIALEGGDRGINPAVASEVATPVSDGYGLGLGVDRSEGELIVGHSGGNEGFRCRMGGFIDRGDAIVVMTNASPGSALVADVLRTSHSVYGWPGREPREVTRVATSEEELQALTGSFAFEGETDPLFVITVDDQDLKIEVNDGGIFRLVKIGENVFVDPEDAEDATFAAAEDGTLTVSTGGNTFVRLSELGE